MEDLERRLIQLEIQGNKTTGNGGMRAFGVVLTIIAVIAGVASIITPMTQQINALNERMLRIEDRIEHQITQLDIKLQMETKAAIDTATLADERNKARLQKLEEWQKWWHRRELNRDDKEDVGKVQ